MRKKADRILRNILPGMSQMIWMVSLAAAVGFGPRMLNIDGDLGRHLTIGGYILDSGSIPTRDLFSHTMPGQPLVPHEWLAQLIFAAAYRLLGLDGVVLVTGVVIATTFSLIYRRSSHAGQSLFAAVMAVLMAMAASSLHWLTRPHIFTFFMLALWVGVLEDMRHGRIWRWWRLPVLMVVWANLHGAFIAGFASWAVYGIGLGWDLLWRRLPKGEGYHGHLWRYYLLGGASSLLVTLINPSGVALWGTSVGYVGNRYLVGHTAEYLPPNFHDPSTWPFLLFIGLLVVLSGLQNRRIDAGKIFLSGAWMVMALYSTRNVPLFAIAAAPVLAELLGGWLSGNHHRLKALARFFRFDQRVLETEQSLRGVIMPLLVLVLLVGGFMNGRKFDFQQRGNAFDPQVFPAAAMDWIESQPQQGRVFNYFPWGGYILFRSWPEQKVFIDGQTDFYGEQLTRQYEQVITLSPGWEAVLQQYEVTWAMVPSGGKLADGLRGSGAWQSVYRDETAEIFAEIFNQ